MKNDKTNNCITKETLQSMFETVKTEYQKKFIEMYDFDSTDCYWIDNVLYISDYYFDFYDVKFAVENNISFEFLNWWYDYSLTVYEFFHRKVSLQEYKLDIIPYKKEDIERLQKLQKEKNHIEAEIDDLINDMKKTSD